MQLLGSKLELHTLWTGAPLGWFERLCLTSMLAHGNEVVVWSYEKLENLPDGVRTAAASEVLPQSDIIRHEQTGSLALFANRFRYRLLRQQRVTWVDIDFLFLQKLTNESPRLFGWEDESSICNAVLRLPSDDPALQDIERFSMASVPIPFWWPLTQQWKQRIAGWRGRHIPAEQMKWGTFGPQALTNALRRHGLEHLALPSHVFYPIYWNEAHLIFEPAKIVESRITSETIAVHLWGDSNLGIKRRQKPQPGSWLANMCERHGVVPN